MELRFRSKGDGVDDSFVLVTSDSLNVLIEGRRFEEILVERDTLIDAAKKILIKNYGKNKNLFFFNRIDGKLEEVPVRITQNGDLVIGINKEQLDFCAVNEKRRLYECSTVGEWYQVFIGYKSEELLIQPRGQANAIDVSSVI